MTPLRRNKAAAFTLIEMITVVGIIALLVALVTPTLLDVIRSTRLSSSGDSLINRLSLAQQSAISMGSEVEMRFYSYINSSSDRPGDDLFYAYQVVHSPQSGVERSLSEAYYLESGIILSRTQQLSPLLQTTNRQRPDDAGNFLFRPPGSTEPENVSYAAMRFFPDGSMKMLKGSSSTDEAQAVALDYTVPPYDESFLTIVESKDAGSAQPRNYFCVQIDSYTGKTRVYRP
ncbi:MAG TPA: hypothetical protein DIT13_06530 [Verrucomicrobiales bacterium]|nr:hypothetical protein [Verrucomicrobiales bacterium]HRJ07723.1 Verru_Chthon cassette protein D [Prosthecobacter sp.]HRK13625.1 Verru_Chthon cassette protein D [Prosthecobacter sp.]